MSSKTDGRLLLRRAVPVHHLGREPRAGDRCRGRRRAVAPAAGGRGDPALARPAQARPVEVHDPAPGAGPGRDPLGRVRGGDHRHAGLADDPQRGPALEGLWRDQGRVPARARRLHLRCEVRPARLSRRRPLQRARDRLARRGRGDRPQGPGAGHQDHRLSRSDRPGFDRSRADGSGRRSRAIRSGARTRPRRRAGRPSCSRSARPARRSVR